MTLEAVCPHCETAFHLQPEMRGRPVRCPECKDVFVAEAAAEEIPYERIEAAPPVALQAEVLPKSGVLLPPLESLPVVMGIPIAASKEKPKPRRAKKAKLGEAPEAIDWKDAPPPGAEPAKPLPAAVPEFVLPKPRRNVWPAVLTGLILLVFVLGAGAGGLYLYKLAKREDDLRERAEAAFKEREFGESAKLYTELIEQFPQSPFLDRYRFFSDLSELKNSLGSSALQSDPKAARARWEAFTLAHGNSPLAKSDGDGYGTEIFDAGRRVCTLFADRAEEKLKEFQGERANRDLLESAETAARDSREFLPIVDRHRPADIEPMEELQNKLAALDGKFRWERDRLAEIDPFRDLSDDPVEERIAEFTAMLSRKGLADDVEARSMIAAANAKLRSLLVPAVDAKPPASLAEVSEKPVITVGIPAGAAKLPPPNPNLPVETVYANARGWLYALDADTAELLWATRTGSDRPPLRIPMADGSGETLLVPVEIDGQPGLVARHSRTGKALWHQPLPAPIGGASAIVGNRVYVPLADAPGTVCEFDIPSGHRLATFRIRQRIGPGVLAIPNTKCIAIVAEARRIFLLDTACQDADGARLPMKLVHVLQTNHPELSLRVSPAFFGIGAPAILLFQNDGTDRTLVRLIDMPPLGDGTNVGESTAVDLAKVEPLPGQLNHPPAIDGERIAAATDLGAFAVFKTNGPGNNDSRLFAMKVAGSLPLRRDPKPALAMLSGEDRLWIFNGADRQDYLLQFPGRRSFEWTPRGEPIPTGLPAAAPQKLPARQWTALTLRGEAVDSFRVAVVNAEGRTLWERTLGAVAAAPPIPSGDGAILIDQDGGAQFVSATITRRLADPAANPIAPTILAGDEQAVWSITPLAKDRARVRLIRGGKAERDLECPLPGLPAGRPARFGDSLIVPVKTGFLYQFDIVSGTFAKGPMWRSPQVVAEAECYLTVTAKQEFYAGDGLRRLQKWRWSESDWAAIGEAIELPAKLAMPALVYSQNNSTYIACADISGSISLYDTANPREPLRRWKPNPDSKQAIPAGPPGLGLFLLPRPEREPLLVYAVANRHLVALDAQQQIPAWVKRKAAEDYDLLGLAVLGSDLLAVDLAGAMELIDGAGQVVDRRAPRAWPSSLPLFLSGKFLQPFADGSAAFLPPFRSAP